MGRKILFVTTDQQRFDALGCNGGTVARVAFLGLGKMGMGMAGRLASAAEGMALAERAGLSLAAVADAMALGQAASPQVVRNTRRMAEGDHERDIVFTPALRLKDVAYALAFARKLGVASPFGDLAEALLRTLCERGDAHANESKIIDVARELKPGTLDASAPPRRPTRR